MDEPNAAASPGQLLTFRSNGQLYALPAAEIAEIIAVPPVARLPQSPKALLGMANLRGSVIAVASLRLLLDDAAEAAGATTRAIVLDGASPVAITVDAVENLVAPDSAEAAERLDIAKLLSSAFAPRAEIGGARKLFRQEAAVHKPAEPLQSAAQPLVTFEVANQRYALPLGDVQEIIAMPAEITTVPRSEALILGLVAYRDTLLPLVSLRGLLGFPFANGSWNKIIVTAAAGVPVGLVADRMQAILHADADLIEPAPLLLAARAGGETRIHSIYRGENGLVSLLATEQLFGDEAMARLGDRTVTVPVAASLPTIGTVVLLVFRLGAEEFGLPIGAVDEVAAIPEKLTRLPKTPKFLSGVTNLRGEVLPVIDLRSRFGLPKFVPQARPQRLVVMRSARLRAGLIVDGISEVFSAPADAIEPAPHLAGEDNRLVRGVLNLEAAARLILILDPDELLTRSEQSLLDEFSERKRSSGQPVP